WVSITPSCSPSAPTTRTCGVRIRSLILGSTLMQHPSSLGVRPNKKCGARAAPPRPVVSVQPLGHCGPEVRSPRFCFVLYAVDGPRIPRTRSDQRYCSVDCSPCRRREEPHVGAGPDPRPAGAAAGAAGLGARGGGGGRGRRAAGHHGPDPPRTPPL